MAVLILLDLSASFDVIDHTILLNRLEYSFGISGNALKSMKSYHSDHVQCVAVGAETSTNKFLK